MPQCTTYITGKALPSREKQNFNFFHLELKVFFIAFSAYGFRVSTRCCIADERELSVGWQFTFYLLRLYRRTVNSELCPLVEKHSDCKFLLLGRRIRSSTTWDFCVTGHRFKWFMSFMVWYLSVIQHKKHSRLGVKESQVRVLGWPSCNYVNLGVNLCKSQCFHQLREFYLPCCAVVLIKWSNTSTCAF